jgi:HPt (histidine-containing phosphotransfer) domain-containing protein
MEVFGSKGARSSMSMEDLLKELQFEYIQSIPEKINEIKNSFEKKNLPALINSFHKLKGSGKTYGLDEVSTLGQFFENWLRDKGEKALPFVLNSIEILNRIYRSRGEGKPYSLESDPEYLKLNSLK